MHTSPLSVAAVVPLSVSMLSPSPGSAALTEVPRLSRDLDPSRTAPTPTHGETSMSYPPGTPDPHDPEGGREGR